MQKLGGKQHNMPQHRYFVLMSDSISWYKNKLVRCSSPSAFPRVDSRCALQDPKVSGEIPLAGCTLRVLAREGCALVSSCVLGQFTPALREHRSASDHSFILIPATGKQVRATASSRTRAAHSHVRLALGLITQQYTLLCQDEREMEEWITLIRHQVFLLESVQQVAEEMRSAAFALALFLAICAC